MRRVVDPLLACGGEMATRLTDHDWASTPLGPIETWSQGLRTATAIVLRSRYPMLLSWGADLVMIYNDAFIPTLGTKHPQALGGLLPVVFSEVWGDVGEMQLSVLAGGNATWDEDLRLMIERGHGPEETFFTFSYSHVPDDAGPGGVLAVLTVTTDKVVAARRLALLNELAQVANQAVAPEPAMAAALEVLGRAEQDLVGSGFYCPAQEPGGTTTLHAIATCSSPGGDPLPASIDDPDHPAITAWMESRVVHAGPSAALPVRGRDGVEGVLLLRPHPYRPFDEDHERFVSLLADQVGQILTVATARAREQARLDALAALDAAKTAFLSNVSHEFRTPLTLLLGPLEDVMDGREKSIERADATVMVQSAHRLLRMVNALLDVARIEADGLTATPTTIDLVQITRDLLQPFERAAERAGLRLEVQLDPSLGLLLVDPELWEKIVLNLVANAIKFTDHGTVGVTLTSRGEHLLLTVSDTGIGMAEEDVGQIFDRFHRIETAGAHAVEGTGIGLTLVAEAAGAMDGTVTARSELGRGSTFEVELPLVPSVETVADWTPHGRAVQALADDAAAPTETRPPPETEDQGGESCILVVEDNVAVRDRVSRLVATLGKVTTAPDGLAALEVLRSRQVDLVVTDVMMPRLDGLGLLKAIREDDDLRSTPVVLLSARAGPEAAAGAIEAGADDYVVKPFTPGELLARCRTSLELAEYRAESAASHVRSTLLAGVSHDMQTPLAVITTSLDLLAEPGIDEDERAHIAERARIRSAQLTRLVTQFLDWSRLSMNQPLPVRVERLDLVEVLETIAAEHERVRVSGKSASSKSWFDRQRTEQIVHNLVENAQRVARSAIEIQHSRDDDHVTVRVIDDGPGVSAEVLPWLFDAFSPSTASKGSGLGLHVSREAARAQGGELVLESTGPTGTVFALRLPRQRP